jgi:preprotein translocase subunit SecD
MPSRTLVWLAITILLAVIAIFVVLLSSIPVRLGLDLSGGTQVLLEAQPAPGQTLDDAAMEQTRQIIENRVNASGLTEPLVQRAGANRVLVELPAEQDPTRAVNTIRQTGLLEFVEVDPVTGQQANNRLLAGEVPVLRTTNSPTPTSAILPPALTTPTPVVTTSESITETGSITPTTATVDPLETQFGPVFPTLFTGSELVPERLAIQPGQLGEQQVAFELEPGAAQVFATYTRDNIGGYLCIVLDNQVNSCPVIRSEIPGGQGVIEIGSGDLQEAQDLLTVLRYGSLPVGLQVVSSRTIGPTLGTESIQDSIVAGVIGLTAVAVFMILYYRVPGVIAVLALLLYTLIVFALFKLLSVTLTLPGIAGFILSIGVAVDGNILIFERMKEELRAGRRLDVAVDVGFERAWPSIRDSNVSTLITCAILFWFGSAFGASIVKGFAITLALGVAVSLFTAIRVTRTLLHLAMDRADFERRHRLLGV